MTDLIIRKATKTDLNSVAAVYEAILDNEDKTGIVYTNWARGKYPTISDAEKAFDADTLYVGTVGDKIIGSFNLNHIQPEEYSKLSWCVEAEGNEVLVIHTLSILPEYMGCGFGKVFVDFAENHAEKLGCKTIRLDTYEGNLPACKMYPKLGYNYAGSAHFIFQGVISEVLKCYDKDLRK